MGRRLRVEFPGAIPVKCWPFDGLDIVLVEGWIAGHSPLFLYGPKR
jgi:hypothetical protein